MSSSYGSRGGHASSVADDCDDPHWEADFDPMSVDLQRDLSLVPAASNRTSAPSSASSHSQQAANAKKTSSFHFFSSLFKRSAPRADSTLQQVAEGPAAKRSQDEAARQSD